MKKIYGLKEWALDKSILNAKRFVDVKIVFSYPDLKQLIEFKPKERIKKIDDIFKKNLSRLIALNLFETYEVNGTKRRPRGVTAKIKFNLLNAIAKLDFVASCWIESIDYATKIEKNEPLKPRYFCVKMTLVIEVEGIKSRKQNIEQRFVLINATSSDDAYDKLEKQKDDYNEPYLNSDGRFVRWRIDSFDDCYETDINTPKDLDCPEGLEVYSKLKSRRLKDKTVWDGKF
ncbi:DUF4288 domain-containing protein [Mucilaginibacter sp.]|uniref:DUF4288 domain-containing protein n=1 Tax=Mucilaginibacter sp. TaxID=1882438 RepID=UPI0025FB8693|nr:DUF4288 domain-containing protein [Mucilaginibacter sp.]